MPRRACANLADIIEACDAISAAVKGLDLAAYRGNRLVQSSVEREFIIIGEAATVLAWRITDFRNQLAHAYATVDDAVVWVIANREARVLRQECVVLLARLQQQSPD
ncbi:MAG: DUF86 domain-containing protein [Planctomycetes bacterium]|nr:DUF86 domain-containing protein [Planctomycetota bacterium]